MIFKTFGICLTFFFYFVNSNNKAVWLWSWLDLYFKDFYILRFMLHVTIACNTHTFVKRVTIALRILLTQHIGLLDHYTVSIHLRRSLKSLSNCLENSSSTGIELMNMLSHTAVCDNLSIVITVVCIHWLYIRYCFLAPFIKCQNVRQILKV